MSLNRRNFLKGTALLTAEAVLAACGGTEQIPTQKEKNNCNELKYPQLTQDVYNTLYYALFDDKDNKTQIARRAEAFANAGFPQAIKDSGQTENSKVFNDGRITSFGFRDKQQVAAPRISTVHLTTGFGKELPITFEITPQEGIYTRNGSLFVYVGGTYVSSYYEGWNTEIKGKYDIEFFGKSYSVTGDGANVGSLDSRNLFTVFSENGIQIVENLKDDNGEELGIGMPLKPDEIARLSKKIEMARATVDFFTLDVEKSLFEQFQNSQ